jgi:hypothetical protein
MAKTAFSKGSEVTAAWANAITNPVYAQNPSNDGELPAPTNADLSQAPGQIVPEWTEFRDQLKVSVTSGLGIEWEGGTIRDAGTGVFVVPAGTLSLANNATNWVHVNTSGSVVSSTTEPGVGVMMARITTSSGAVQTVVDLRRTYGVGPISKIIKYFGGTGIDGPKVCTNGEMLRGIYNFTSFTVPSGATVTIGAFARIYCTGNVLIQGVINVAHAVNGGTGFATTADGNLGGGTGNGLGGGSGSGVSSSYHFAASNLGSGGGSGFISNQPGQSSLIAGGGAGGGALLIEAIGIVSITGSITANGATGGSGLKITGTSQAVSGAGGGSGGLIWITSLFSVVGTGAGVTLSARGGDGGNAVAGANANGGGGGGGGWIVLAAPDVNATGANVLVTGGLAGTTIGTPETNLGGGTGGSFAGQGGASASGGVFAGGTGTFLALTNILSIG